ncbi:hypothetical protein EVAR_20003_1 [Eumeta japonica]|uniref:Uncharacterized protein n=1 Tax=Eumeta variegata TaxID=151549 RepID=A0A4C1V9T4_EUMVA|nr:hypothetical protein EVAR_20003_1 [Eumeta japonica]
MFIDFDFIFDGTKIAESEGERERFRVASVEDRAARLMSAGARPPRPPRQVMTGSRYGRGGAALAYDLPSP